MRWTPHDTPNAGAVEELAQTVTKDPLLAKLLVQRGITDFDQARTFFRPDLKHLHEPLRMKDMEAAVERIEKARIAREHVMIFGDYDVDGTTSVALLCEFLDGKFPIEAYIPDRYKEGYGLSFDGINLAAELGITLLIALDCGTKAFDQIAHARKLGIDVIVCDHHRPEGQLPRAAAILNPKRSDCLYPFKELSGCGVGFKLAHALCDRWGLPLEHYLYPLLDLCAISIAADIVPVDGENRILAYYGMERLRRGEARAGVKALIAVAGKKESSLVFRDLGFTIGPRINAAGRIESGLRAVELLRSKNVEEQRALAERIQAFNEERREIQGVMYEEALKELATDDFPYSNVLYKVDWHKGVVGIVASKVVEHRYRPTIVLTKSGDTLAGSARSVTNFDLYEALEACEAHLIQFGGHTYAAGMTLYESQLPHFKRAFEAYCAEHLSPNQLEPVLHYDAPAHLDQFTTRFHDILRQYAPHGPQNTTPTFLLHNLTLASPARAVGKTGEHLKLHVTQPGAVSSFHGIAFGAAPHLPLLESGQPFDAIVSLTLNHFRGNSTLELYFEDLRASNHDHPVP